MLAKGFSLARGTQRGSWLKGDPGWGTLLTSDLLIQLIYLTNGLGPSTIWGPISNDWYAPSMVPLPSCECLPSCSS